MFTSHWASGMLYNLLAMPPTSTIDMLATPILDDELRRVAFAHPRILTHLDQLNLTWQVVLWQRLFSNRLANSVCCFWVVSFRASVEVAAGNLLSSVCSRTKPVDDEFACSFIATVGLMMDGAVSSNAIIMSVWLRLLRTESILIWDHLHDVVLDELVQVAVRMVESGGAIFRVMYKATVVGYKLCFQISTGW